VKLGGGLLAHPDAFAAALETIAAAARRGREALLVVPGGGPFADAVREADRRLGLSSDAAHWMAVLAMDQYAHLIASRLDGAQLVTACSGIECAGVGHVRVLAPYRWLRDADPLPHSWDVTSDSIAAWIAGILGARRLVLVKPPGAAGDDLLDPFFPRARPPGVSIAIVPAHGLEACLRRQD
jgi:aspartokinase-like uncharacterized kinase